VKQPLGKYPIRYAYHTAAYDVLEMGRENGNRVRHNLMVKLRCTRCKQHLFNLRLCVGAIRTARRGGFVLRLGNDDLG
jgi:hypothetical protein